MLWTWLFYIESTGSQSIGFSIETLNNYSFIGMIYITIKYSTISNDILSMNIESWFNIFYTDFYSVGLNNIEYFTSGISDDGIS